MSLKIPSNHPDGDFYKYCADSLGFEPSDEFSDGESKAEITEGGWRCHLQRMVKIYDGGSDRINYFRDRNTKDGTRKSYTLSEHFSNVDEGNQPQGPSVESQTIREDAVSSEEVVAGPEPIYKLYRTFKDPRPSKYSDPHGSEEQHRLIERNPSYYLEIRSPLILRLLRNLVAFYPGTDLNGASVRIPEPYMLLWHHHTALRCFLQKDSNDEDTKKHLRGLLEFLDSNESDAKEFKALDQAPRGTGVISYRNAWYLYRPGCWVSRWDPALSTTVLRVIKSVEAASKTGLKLAPVFDGLTIRYRGLSSEGTTSIWLKEKSEDIKENQFSAKVSELQVVPLEYAQNQEEILRVAGQRGLKYWQLTSQCLQEFVGSRTDDTPDVSFHVTCDVCLFWKSRLTAGHQWLMSLITI